MNITCCKNFFQEKMKDQIPAKLTLHPCVSHEFNYLWPSNNQIKGSTVQKLISSHSYTFRYFFFLHSCQIFHATSISFIPISFSLSFFFMHHDKGNTVCISEYDWWTISHKTTTWPISSFVTLYIHKLLLKCNQYICRYLQAQTLLEKCFWTFLILLSLPTLLEENNLQLGFNEGFIIDKRQNNYSLLAFFPYFLRRKEQYPFN